jgi:hypothetical protein
MTTAAKAKAGTLYALIVFLIGFLLGTVRVLLIVPRAGDISKCSALLAFIVIIGPDGIRNAVRPQL